VGVAQKNINLAILRDIKIPVPPLSKQKEIVKEMQQRDKDILDYHKKAEDLEKDKVNALSKL